MIDPSRLQIFLSLSRHGSFTKAARELGVTQPAVSASITELEKQVGATLVDRTRGKICLTQAGEKFLDYARQILYWNEAALRALHSGEDALIEKKVSPSEGVLCRIVPPGDPEADVLIAPDSVTVRR